MLNFIINNNIMFFNGNFYLLIILLLVISSQLLKLFVENDESELKKISFSLLLILCIYSFIPYYYYNKSMEYLKEKPQNITKAINARTTAAKLTLNPLDKNMMYNSLAGLYIKEKKYDEAINFHKMGSKSIKNQGMVETLLISNAYLKLGNNEEAIRILLEKEKLESLWTNKMIIYNYLSKIFYEAGNYEIAYNYINKYARIYNANRNYTPMPCEIIARRAVIARKINKQDVRRHDELYLMKYCSNRK